MLVIEKTVCKDLLKFFPYGPLIAPSQRPHLSNLVPNCIDSAVLQNIKLWRQTEVDGHQVVQITHIPLQSKWTKNVYILILNIFNTFHATISTKIEYNVNARMATLYNFIEFNISILIINIELKHTCISKWQKKTTETPKYI